MLHSAHKIEQGHKNKQSIFTVLSYAILSQFFSARSASSLIRLLMRPTLWNPKLSIGIMYSTGFLQDWWGAVWAAMQIQIQKRSGQWKLNCTRWCSDPVLRLCTQTEQTYFPIARHHEAHISVADNWMVQTRHPCCLCKNGAPTQGVR